jgi:hypothetical protein
LLRSARVPAPVHNHFNQERTLHNRQNFKLNWTCRGFVPLQMLVWATFRSKATELFPPNAE